MNSKTIDRRGFLERGALAASLAAAGRLPLLGAPAKSGSGIDAPGEPHAVKPIRDYLPRFTPATGPLKDKQNYTLTYDILHWGGANWQAGKPTVTPLGRITVRRMAAKGKIQYAVKQQTTIARVENVIEAEIRCNVDGLNSLREWKFRSWSTKRQGGIDPLSELKETGVIKANRIQIDSGSHRYGFDAKHPVATQWTILDFVARKAWGERETTFDLLQDMSLFKPNQSLLDDGNVRVEVRDGKTVKLQSYLQTGEGILPIHYLCDAEGRPQLVTSSLLSWALTGVS